MGLLVSLLSAVMMSLLPVAAPVPAPRTAPHVRALPTGTDVDYQLGGARSVPDHVGIVVRDRTATPAAGAYDVCYVNGFQTQDSERAFWRQHWSLVLKQRGRPVVDEAWGEFLLDLRTAAKRKALAGIVDGWVRGCARTGYSAVEFDNLDSYTRSHHLLTRSQAVAYARLLVASAHRAGLAAGQKNLSDFDGTSIGYDFAVAEECARYSECGSYLRHYGDRVLMIEYRDADFAKSCAAPYADRVAVERRDRDLSPSYSPRWC